MPAFDLTGHVALVTGGNGGIGFGMAEGLARAGADLAIWGTNEEKNAAAAERLRAHGHKVVALRCDVGDEGAVDEAFAATVAALGKVDSCFANAAIAGAKVRFPEQTLEEWRRVMRINLEGAFLTLRAAARHMVERGEGGSLVAISSIAAVEGASRDQAYAASKAGVVAMVRGIATELASKGIRANCVLPGWIDTAATKDLFAWDRFRENVLPRVPVGRWGEIEDFAGIAVYLASDLSRFHTGDSIVVDGGYTLF